MRAEIGRDPGVGDALAAATASMDVRGRDGTIKISYISHSGGSNVNINAKGEVWVGYPRLTNNHVR